MKNFAHSVIPPLEHQLLRHGHATRPEDAQTRNKAAQKKFETYPAGHRFDVLSASHSFGSKKLAARTASTARRERRSIQRNGAESAPLIVPVFEVDGGIGGAGRDRTGA